MRKLKLFMMPAVVAALMSCGGSDEPAYRAAVREAVVAETGCRPGDIVFSDCEICETVTYGDELERRKEIFRYRIRVNEKMRDDYLRERKRTNARLKAESIEADYQLLQRLDSLEDAHADILEKVEYYDCRFSAKVRLDRYNTFEFRDAHAALDGSWKLFDMSSSQKDLRLGMGKLFPGYEKLLEDSHLEDDIKREYNEQHAAEKEPER